MATAAAETGRARAAGPRRHLVCENLVIAGGTRDVPKFPRYCEQFAMAGVIVVISDFFSDRPNGVMPKMDIRRVVLAS